MECSVFGERSGWGCAGLCGCASSGWGLIEWCRTRLLTHTHTHIPIAVERKREREKECVCCFDTVDLFHISHDLYILQEL